MRQSGTLALERVLTRAAERMELPMLKRIRPLIIASAILTTALVSAVSAYARQPQPEGPPPGVRYYEAVGMQSLLAGASPRIGKGRRRHPEVSRGVRYAVLQPDVSADLDVTIASHRRLPRADSQPSRNQSIA